jgi:hypothetical protein
MTTINGESILDADERADMLAEARALRAAARRVCPECHEMGGHRYGCPACPEDDDEPEAA